LSHFCVDLRRFRSKCLSVNKTFIKTEKTEKEDACTYWAAMWSAEVSSWSLASGRAPTSSKVFKTCSRPKHFQPGACVGEAYGTQRSVARWSQSYQMCLKFLKAHMLLTAPDCCLNASYFQNNFPKNPGKMEYRACTKRCWLPLFSNTVHFKTIGTQAYYRPFVVRVIMYQFNITLPANNKERHEQPTWHRIYSIVWRKWYHHFKCVSNVSHKLLSRNLITTTQRFDGHLPSESRLSRCALDPESSRAVRKLLPTV